MGSTYFCDDGNLVAGDGCDGTCAVEYGWTCFGGNSTYPDFCWRPYPRITNLYISTNNSVLTMVYNESTFMLTTFTKD